MPELTPGEEARPAPVIRAHVFVSGRVQGVFFRQGTYEQAVHLGLSGWVRNIPDGRVEAVFEGSEEAVRAMVAWCGQGTPWASVGDVEATDEPPEGLEGFRIK